MAMWSRLKRNPPPTSTGSAGLQIPSEVEKIGHGDLVENAAPVHGDVDTRHAHPDVERRVVRKMDLRVVSLVTALYVLAFLDRSNIGNAKIAGMEQALHLVGSRYQVLLNVFYVTYIVFEFQALMWKLIPPHIWLTITVLAWGIFATCQAATQTYGGMVILRLLLGIAEAGFGPGIPYLLSFFYLRHEVGLRIAIFLSAAPLATTFSGALAYG